MRTLVIYTRLFMPANLFGSTDGSTYELTAMTVNSGTSDVAVAWDHTATMSASDVTLAVS